MQQLSREGTKICPNCAEVLQAAAIFCRFCHRGLSSIHYKKCPHCAEMVRKSANRCRFCQSDLSEPAEGRPPHGAPVPRIPVNPRRSAEIALPLPEPSESQDVCQSLPRLNSPEKREPS